MIERKFAFLPAFLCSILFIFLGGCDNDVRKTCEVEKVYFAEWPRDSSKVDLSVKRSEVVKFKTETRLTPDKSKLKQEASSNKNTLRSVFQEDGSFTQKAYCDTNPQTGEPIEWWKCSKGVSKAREHSLDNEPIEVLSCQ